MKAYTVTVNIPDELAERLETVAPRQCVSKLRVPENLLAAMLERCACYEERDKALGLIDLEGIISIWELVAHDVEKRNAKEAGV